MVLSFGQWRALEQREHEQRQERFERDAQDVSQRVLSRMQAYEMVLRGTSGLMASGEIVSLDEWERAMDQLQLQDRYPGIQALGWSRYLRADQLEKLIAQEPAKSVVAHCFSRRAARALPADRLHQPAGLA